MRKMIPFAPWQTAYFLRWLRDMSQKGWELKAIKGFHAVFAPGTSGGQNYALFPPDATAQDLDELFLRLEDGSLTAPPELDRPMPNRLVLPEDPRLAQLVGKIGPYKYIQLVYQLRRDNGWAEVCEWGGFTVMRSTRPDAVPPPRLTEYTEKTEETRKGRFPVAALDLGFLLALPALALIKDTGLLFWQKGLAGGAALAAACFIMSQVLGHAFSRKAWDNMSYEDCLHKAGKRAALLYIIVIGAPIAAMLHSAFSLLLR